MSQQRSNLARAAGIDPGFQAPPGALRNVDPRFHANVGSRNIDPGFSPGSSEAIAYLNSLLGQKGVDVKAADAVFGREGMSGGIGDGGHAFGPGQFNNAGGVWTGRYPGMTPQQENAMAWSPAGLAELAQRVAAVAGGLKGPAAIQNIVSRFERPQNPQAEISGALSAYGAPVPAGMPGSPPPSMSMPPQAQQPAQQTGLARMLAAAVGNANQTVGLPNPVGIGQLLAKAAAGRAGR